LKLGEVGFGTIQTGEAVELRTRGGRVVYGSGVQDGMKISSEITYD